MNLSSMLILMLEGRGGTALNVGVNGVRLIITEVAFEDGRIWNVLLLFSYGLGADTGGEERGNVRWIEG